jgi:hypothetical protein
VVLSPAVNTGDKAPPKKLAFHIVPPHYFDPFLIDSNDWASLLSGSLDKHPVVPAGEGASFNVLNEIFMKTVPKDVDLTAAMAARSQLPPADNKKSNEEEEKEINRDTWGGSSLPDDPKIAEKQTEPSTIGSSATTPQQQSAKLHIADSSKKSITLNVEPSNLIQPLITDDVHLALNTTNAIEKSVDEGKFPIYL